MEVETVVKKEIKKSAPKIQVPKLFMKGNLEFTHSLFKCLVGTFKKNISWRKYRPQLIDVEHTHFFHTHDRRGKENQYTTPTAGHFHKVTIKDNDGSYLMDSNEYPTIKIGPPLMDHYKKLKSGTHKKIIIPVAYYNEDKNEDIEDEHTHACEYLGSEILSEVKIKQTQQENQQAISNMTGGLPKPQLEVPKLDE